jgi:DNA-binding CsgD family transcriptional regulator
MSITCIAAWALALLLLPVLILLWATETRTQRIRRWRKEGMTQKAIAQRLGCSLYQVRKALVTV